jgi:hypothetical protein
MHESRKQLSAALAPLLKSHGYKKRDLSWHKLCSDTVLVFHAEKNRWGFDSYSFHLGIYLLALGSETSPPHYRCHVQINLDRLVPDQLEFEHVCDFKNTSVTVADKLDRIVQFVSAYALPWLDQHSTIAALRRLAECDYATLLPRVQIFRVTYDYLRNRL